MCSTLRENEVRRKRDFCCCGFPSVIYILFAFMLMLQRAFIAQMLHWLEFRDMHGLFSTVPFFDHAVRGMQITL